MSLETYLRSMPKVELHVHLEGSIQPETLLELAQRNNKPLPFSTAEALREWYRFRDFPHFVDIYVAISNCLKTADDIELITREFLQGQAAQNAVHSEVTYTALTVHTLTGLSFDEQLDAINRARRWAEQTLGVTMALVTDIAREVTPEDGMITADWAITGFGRGVDAFGLGGYEVGHPTTKHNHAFDRARAAGLPSVPHAGETEGPESIWGAVRRLGAQRIGHGVRCLEDSALVTELRARQIPLEVCPSSNVCLGVAPSLREHPLPRLIEAGLYVTINSDDPPLFNTTLNDEYVLCAEAFGFDAAQMEQLSLNALRASLLRPAQRQALERRFLRDFARLRMEHGVDR
jgi:aminodeoxyfutalosine deaminase